MTAVQTTELRARPPVPPTSAAELMTRSRLSVPRPTRLHLRRPRLSDRLARTDAPLVLLSAPAGSGKTALAAEWAHRLGDERLVTWVDCQDEDADPWADILLGLREEPGPDEVRTGAPVAGRRTLREGMRLVLEAADRSPRPLTVFLDGYQVRSLEVAHQLESLLRYAEGRLQLVLTTRVDPVLPLHRYRLRGDLLELRVADLAFTDEEAVQLLTACGVELGPADVHALNTRLSGWAAGLRFAVPAMLGHPAPEVLVSTAVTYNGDINAYLVEEVLNVQPPHVRDLILSTSVPDALTPELLEELAGDPAAPTALALTRANVFLETLPGRTSSLRYVPFFRDLVRAQLAYESPERLVELHRTVAAWYTRHGIWDQVVVHLAGAGEWDGVADLLVEHLLLGRLLCDGAEGALGQVTAAFRSRTRLGSASHLVAAAVALLDDDHDSAAAHLAAARSGEGLSAAGVVTASVLDALGASDAADAGTAEATAASAEEALEEHRRTVGHAAGGDLAAVVVLCRARAALRAGRLDDAGLHLDKALASETGSSAALYRAACLALSAVLEARSGRLTTAAAAADEALLLDGGHLDAGLARSTRATARLAAAYVALEGQDLTAVRAHLAEVAGCPGPAWGVLSQVVTAALDREDGGAAVAGERLDAALATAGPAGQGFVDWLRVESAHARLALGQPEQALARLRDASTESVEVCAAVATAELASGNTDAAGARLKELRGRAGATLRDQVVVGLLETAVLAPGAVHRARATLTGALRLARAEGLRRPFLDADPAVEALLAELGGGAAVAWLRTAPRDGGPGPGQGAGAAAEGAPEGRVVEPLTPRELEVLACMSEWLTTEEIAEKLFVSVNTVRTHVRNILTKLGVSRRNAAIREAFRLGLLGP